MLTTFDSLKNNFKLKAQSCYIDNWVFQMHYRVTALIFFGATVLVTSRQYIGEHIKCITGGSLSNNGMALDVINTFCFFTSTFTVESQYDSKVVASGNVAHPGVGAYSASSPEPITKHAYYQWVPFVLFLQGMMFMFTHILWKHLEGGRLKKMISGMELTSFAYLSVEVKVGDKKIPTKEKKEEYLNLVRQAFKSQHFINRSWGDYLILCEILNVLNVVLQVYITDKFLGGKFMELGSEVIENGLESPVTIFDEVFPKVTKCTFYKYGDSGSIQHHDAMCVMALNILNEKIYVFLWFWFIVIFIVSCLGVIWRILTIILHSKSTAFNKVAFANSCPGKNGPWKQIQLTGEYHFGDWIFLKYLSKNMDGNVFKELFVGLAEQMELPLKKSNSDSSLIKEPLIDV